ncbi:MAG: hypothetical protein HW395_1427, partial [candidate division NC10 bacterium]|nr:hypothetical protein [candidate division NC10 bacterium]
MLGEHRTVRVAVEVSLTQASPR